MAPTQKRTPEDVVEQLRAILSELDEITPLSFAERRDLRNKLKTSEETVQASVSIIAASDKVANAIGWSSEDVLEIFSDRRRWSFVESELRTLLNGVSSANLRRRHQLEMIAGDAYAIAARLARDPANADLIPFVEEMQRLRKLERRRKRSSRRAPEAPLETKEEA
ncbi:MAG TPA: hypothetical protein VGQ65_21610 [Thermoanaerobaculia bacterium]|jgi:hypothetical protein|nr:hypothetical protein [Thermoanaerobaculia bacterium]